MTDHKELQLKGAQKEVTKVRIVFSQQQVREKISMMMEQIRELILDFQSFWAQLILDIMPIILPFILCKIAFTMV